MFNAAVKRVQEDLRTLGFTVVGEADGQEGPRYHRAIREFQIFANSARVASEVPVKPTPLRWVERLQGVDNTTPSPPKVNGIADSGTLAAIAYWLATERNYRCPLVFEARAVGKKIKSSTFIPTLANVWDFSDPGFAVLKAQADAEKIKGYRIELRYCDFTVPVSPATDWDKMVVLGQRMHGVGFIGGVPSVPRRPELQSECLPENTSRASWKNLTGPAKSVFRVIRTVAERECIGYFDALNSYDNAVMSLGPCHWTLTLGRAANGSKKATSGELPATLAFAIGRDPSLAIDHLTPYGVGLDGKWENGKTGSNFNVSWQKTRNYAGWMAWTHDGARIDMLSDLEWFRGPHWFKRIKDLQRAKGYFSALQWDMVRMRLRDLMCAPVGSGPYSKNQLGEIFTTELAAAMLLRLHVRYSGILDPKPRAAIVKMIKLSGVTGDVKNWGQTEQTKLIDGLKAFAIRLSYPLHAILAPSKEIAEPTLKALLEYGEKRVALGKTTPKEGPKDLHQAFLAIEAWPDTGLFNVHGYTLETDARVALSKVDKSFSHALKALIADKELPPPPIS